MKNSQGIPIAQRKKWVFLITKIACRILLEPFFQLKTKGSENLPQGSGYILLPKHQRWEDIPLLGLAARRTLYYVAKNDLFKNPVTNWFFRSLGGIPLNREHPLKSRDSLPAIIEILKKGEGVVVFPEGTYYINKIGSGHIGIVRLILSRLSIPFIPVGINYSENGGRRLVQVNFDKASYADPALSVDLFLDILMREIAELSGLR